MGKQIESMHALSMQLSNFIQHYRDTVISQLATTQFMQSVSGLTQMITRTIRAHGSIYVFGNGGSHAIARQFESSMIEELAGGTHPVRIRWGVDFHASQSIVRRHGYEHIFKQLLCQEHTGPNDLVLLVSGSGNSTNLMVAAEYCRQRGIPCAGLAAFSGGQLCDPGVVDLPISIPVADQQIGEDVVQSLLQISAWYSAELLHSTGLGLESITQRYMEMLDSGFARLDPYFLISVGTTVSNAYLHDRRVYVLAPEGGGVSLSAEHVAHNLNWDAVYQVQTPPRRYLTSTPSGCDFSGIGNDRFLAGVVSCQQISVAAPGDVLIVFAVDAGEPAVRETLNYGKKHGMRLFGFSGIGTTSDDTQRVFGVRNRAVVADLCQAAGHMLGRVVRLTLKTIEDGAAPDDLLAYLVNDDLAQRRLLHVIDGL